MLNDYKVWLAAVAVGLTIFAYIPYLRGIYSGVTKPHLYTWAVWTLTTLIAAVIQIAKGGAAGSWSTFVAALLCFWITCLSVQRGSKDIRRVDRYFLIASLAAVPLWIVLKDPTWSAILLTGIELVASFPTLRKSWLHPEQEVPITWGINAIRFSLSIAALGAYSIATTAYPAGMVLMNGLICIEVLIRGKILKKTKTAIF